MKKFISLVLVLVLALSLAACGNKNADTPDASTNPDPSNSPSVQDPSFGIDLSKFYADMMEAAGETPMMMDLAAEAEMLESMYPGLGAVEAKQLVAFAPAMTAVAMEFVFVEVANASDVETVKGILQARIDAQVDGGAWYPETIEGWKNHSEIVVIDNYVCLFVTSDKDGLIDAFRNNTEIPAWAVAPEGEGDVGGMDTPVEDDVPAFDPDAEVSNAPAADGVDLMAFYTSLCDQYGENFPANASLTEMPEMLDMTFPGLSEIETKQLVAFQPMMGAVVCEIVLAEVVNSADVAAVKDILQARIDAQVDGGAWYPETIEGWEKNSRIVDNGNYVMMIAYSFCDKIVESFNALF